MLWKNPKSNKIQSNLGTNMIGEESVPGLFAELSAKFDYLGEISFFNTLSACL